MKTASSTYKMLRALSDSEYEIKIVQGNKTYELDKLKSVNVHQSLTGGKGVSIGGTNASECRITVVEQSSNWARMAQFTLQFRICLGNTKSEWITFGTYYTDSRSEDRFGNLTIIGYDGMLLTEQYWTDKIPSASLPASFPITAKAFATMVQSAGLCTFEDLTQLDDSVAFIGLDTGSTIRDKLKDIAAVHGGNWQITPTGALKLVNYRMVENSYAIAGIAVAGIAIVGVTSAEGLPSSRYVTLGLGMKVLEKSPAIAGVSGVTLETDEGITVSAGTDSQYMVKGTCNFAASDGVANLCLNRLLNYSYKPFTFKTVDLDPLVDAGDIAIADGDGYQIMDIEWTFSKRPYANLSAPYDEEVDHEYTIVSPEAKTYRKGLAALGDAEARINSSIEQTATSIITTVSQTYETKTDASGKLTAAQNYADSQIQQTAESITATVSASQKQYDTESYTISLYGYGAPSATQYPPESYNNKYYLNQSDGSLYKSNGSTWSKVKNLNLITTSQQTQITQNANNITAKVSKVGGNNNSFGWAMNDSSHIWYANSQEVMKLTSAGLVVKGEIRATTGFIGDGTNGFTITNTGIYKGMTSFGDTQHDGVYIGSEGISLGGGKFKVDMYGNVTASSGTFTGSVYAKDIIVGRQQDGTDAGYITGSQIGSGTVTGGSGGNIGEYTIGDVNVGSNALTTDSLDTTIGTSLGYADFFNDSTADTPTRYPNNFTAKKIDAITAFYSGSYKVREQGEIAYDLTSHYHTITISNGKVQLGLPTKDAPNPFDLGDAIGSGSILATNGTSVRDFSSGFDFDLTNNLYIPSASPSTAFGRIQILDTSGTVLKKIRVQVPNGGAISGASGLTTSSSNYTSYDYPVSFAASSLYTSGSTTYARVQVSLSNNTSKVVRVGIPASGGSSNIASIVSASTDSDYSDYYYSGGRWKLYVHAKDSNGNTLFTDTIDVQRAVDYGASQGASGYVEVTSTSSNSAFVKLYNSSRTATIPINGSSVGRWIDAGTSYPFG